MIIWPTPAPIFINQPLTGVQLDATAVNLREPIPRNVCL